MVVVEAAVVSAAVVVVVVVEAAVVSAAVVVVVVVETAVVSATASLHGVKSLVAPRLVP